MSEPIISFLQRKLRAAGPRRFAAIAEQAGVAESLLPKLAYGMRDNPRLRTIQPLLDYFQAVDRGERLLPDEAAAPSPAPAADLAVFVGQGQ